MQVSCDGGSTWMPRVNGSGSVGGGMTISYPTPVCSGPTNLNTLLFRAILGGGGDSSFNMSFESPSSVTLLGEWGRGLWQVAKEKHLPARKGNGIMLPSQTVYGVRQRQCRLHREPLLA